MNSFCLLYAPDVTLGPDGRYYLYYCLDHLPIVSVAVCDSPAGKYEFYGYLHYQDGTILGYIISPLKSLCSTVEIIMVA